jgi:hypothetical protein
MMLGNGCFSWSSKKQTATALSTGEAEYYATTHAGHEILWLQQLLTEIGFAPTVGTTLHIDNTSSICMIETPDQVTNCIKHINIAYHWICEEVQKQSIKPVYVLSDRNILDIFTKGFHAPCHKELGGVDLYTSTYNMYQHHSFTIYGLAYIIMFIYHSHSHSLSSVMFPIN